MFLSFTSVCLSKYHGRTNETIYELCYKQVINITIGIVLAVILNSFLWPVLARRELRKEIAQLISREGVLFAEMMNRFMLQDPEQAVEYQRFGLQSGQQPFEQVHEKVIYVEGTGLAKEPALSTEARMASPVEAKEDLFGGASGTGVGAAGALCNSVLEPAEAAPTYDKRASIENRRRQDDAVHLRRRTALDADRIAFQHVENQLQARLLKIGQLLELSRSEPRMKEPFPEKLYSKIILCCQNILDRIISMRMAAQLFSPEVRDLIIGPMNYYRRDLVRLMCINSKKQVNDPCNSTLQC